jgi:hypothetical protein
MNTRGLTARRVGRRTLAVAAIMLAGIGATLWGIQPSYAVASPTFASGTSALNSTNFKNATARCPVGLSVYGASYNVKDGLGKVAVNTLQPDRFLNTVFVEANEVGSGITTDWSVTAEAICGPAVANLQRVTGSAAVSSSATKSIAVPCPAGTKVYGGGFIFPFGYGEVFMNFNFANSNLLAWNVTATKDDDPALAWGIEAYAICGAPAATQVAVVQNDFLQDSSSPRTEDVSCPTGTKLHSTGVIANGANSDVLIEDMTSTAALRSTIVKAFENDSTTSTWFAAASAVCAS